MTHTLHTTLLSGASLLFSSYLSAEAEKKNILFIAIDDLKPLIGCYGNQTAITPNIDRLAERGCLFENTFCQQAVSGPSRASLLTGMRPDYTKVWDLKTVIRDINPDIVTLPQYFKANGYHVTGVGKIYDPRSVDKGLDTRSWSVPFIKTDSKLPKNIVSSAFNSPETIALYQKYHAEAIAQGMKPSKAKQYAQEKTKFSTECIDIHDTAYSDGLTTEAAIDAISKYDGKQPLFMAVGYKKPHLPFVAPKKYWDLYDRADIPLPAFTDMAKNSPTFAYHQSGELHGYIDVKEVSHHDKNKLTRLPESKTRELIHGYYACISYTDTQIGKLLEALEAKGMSDNTIIVLWGDHGWHLGDHGLWNKHSNFEQATHVPMIIVDPSSKKQRIASPTEFVDIYPTLCGLAGLEIPTQLHGDNLAALVHHGDKAAADLKPYAVSQYHRVNKMGYSIRTEQYRYTVWVDWKNRILNAEEVQGIELYDYTKDPNETVNVANDKQYSQVAAQMQTYWEEYKTQYLQ